jgi:hypothetical protein
MPSSGEGRFDHLSPRGCSMGAPLIPTTTATWKENAPTMMTFPPWMTVPWLETNQPIERHHAHHEGQPTQSRARHPHAEPGSASQWSKLADRQTATVVQSDASPRCEPMLETKRILMVDFTSTQTQAKDLAPPVRQGEARTEVVAARSPSASPRSPPMG